MSLWFKRTHFLIEMFATYVKYDDTIKTFRRVLVKMVKTSSKRLKMSLCKAEGFQSISYCQVFKIKLKSFCFHTKLESPQKTI